MSNKRYKVFRATRPTTLAVPSIRRFFNQDEIDTFSIKVEQEKFPSFPENVFSV